MWASQASAVVHLSHLSTTWCQMDYPTSSRTNLAKSSHWSKWRGNEWNETAQVSSSQTSWDRSVVVSTRKSSWVRLRTTWRWLMPVRAVPMATGVAQIDQTQASSKLLPTKLTTSRSWGSRYVVMMKKNSLKCSNINSRYNSALNTNRRT